MLNLYFSSAIAAIVGLLSDTTVITQYKPDSSGEAWANLQTVGRDR
ncbi:MAG: hypothetical protein F6K30_20175 [Cyanothece sp. SIO2G6]|nr:hypothetical protein [Cyanothece sp. SIO2G6]